jgi:phenylalanyl-tRNA synthetase alpha chain
MSVFDDLESIRERALAQIKASGDLKGLDAVRVAVSGKKGELTEVLHSMGSVSAEDRPRVGKLANEVRAQVEAALAARKEQLEALELDKRMASEAVDVTLPGRVRPLGHESLINSIIEEAEDFFSGIGYTIKDGPRVETEYYNFTALNTPPDHPSRSARDTFYVVDESAGADGLPTTGVIGESNVLLRTQTSGVQVHTMEESKPPIYMICPGTVFRPDAADPNHLPQFHQIEGLVVDRGITFGDLKGTLDAFSRAMFGSDRKTRYRPHFFPFTEPSCEVDVSCGNCGGKGCRFCKYTGWLEILGCGMVDPNVLSMSGIDPEEYSGFAFGIGVERVACLRYDLPDLRMLVQGDMRFIQQF